ncbi:hypothetical protein [Pimelobacter simplex]|uniref:hypothetical protein n=1 Tax=Nocardioides simplex TaxID=2045 RepID=UPI00214FCCA2|nr:hypothetical protein [Pimelobacter simplex]UUW89388.1 hypothetical protein M0M43_27210 [Pimelobacter simplex]
MDPLSWTDEHARLVADAAPDDASTAPGEAELTRTWNVIRAGLDDAPPPRRRRRRRLIAAGVAAAVLAVPAGLAAADGWGARTGRSAADAEDLRLGGPGEHLDPAGADFGQVIEEETRDIRFPTAATRRIALDAHVEDARRSGAAPGTTAVSTGAIRGWTAIFAVCAWSNTWKRAIDDGDTALRDEAAAVLVAARTWPAVTDLDPRQATSTTTMDVYDPETGATTTEVHDDPTQYYYLREVTRAVAAGDVDALGATLAAHAYCLGPELMPDFPQALPSDDPVR